MEYFFFFETKKNFASEYLGLMALPFSPLDWTCKSWIWGKVNSIIDWVLIWVIYKLLGHFFPPCKVSPLTQQCKLVFARLYHHSIKSAVSEWWGAWEGQWTPWAWTYCCISFASLIVLPTERVFLHWYLLGIAWKWVATVHFGNLLYTMANIRSSNPLFFSFI